MTRHDKGGRGGHVVHDIMFGEKTKENIRGKGEEIKNKVRGTSVNIYISPGILVNPKVHVPFH